ncbi:butyrophilin subfamily 2 member A2-like isoform X1 [Channa argus]|uniref:butyrophilin subfamily 2 member A2-like isoform X1 n=2 Tax=Channa argus TaxID=215402 RepID=UPI003520AE24
MKLRKQGPTEVRDQYCFSFENCRMPRQKNDMLIKCGLTLLFIFCRDQSQACPSQIKVAVLGETVVLPCHLETPVDATDLVVEWARPDLSPGFVYVWKNNEENPTFKQTSYTGRTSLFVEKLKHGEVSLKLSKVTLSDEGLYRCRLPTVGQESFVRLIVGSVSDPVIDVAPKNSEELLLQCKSEGWYPEPEVLWLDGEGNVLSAGPTETVRGPDDLYTVSSRVTVDKRHGHRFTCRVQQNIINQTRETNIYIYYSTTDSPNATSLIFRALAFGSVCIVIFVWKWG